MLFKFFKSLFTQKIDIAQIEEMLIQMDMNTNMRLQSLEVIKSTQNIDALLEYWKKFLQPYESPLTIQNKPAIFLFSGVNGSGKTTTIGKLINRWCNEYTIKVVAADTFRYAASEQLAAWIQNNCSFISEHNLDPAALIYKALEHNSHEIVLIDTAGRLSNNVPLMDQLSKVTRSILKHAKIFQHILVIDSSIGSNAISQYRSFNTACKVDKIILTKVDATQKCGTLFNLCHTFHTQIACVCTGETKNDICDFKAEQFIKNLI